MGGVGGFLSKHLVWSQWSLSQGWVVGGWWVVLLILIIARVITWRAACWLQYIMKPWQEGT